MSPPAAQPTLEHARLVGERVELRPLSVGDVPRAFELLHGRREITDWLLWDGPESAEELVDWYERWADRGPDGANYHFAVRARGEELFLGSIGLRFRGHEYQGDLGYWLTTDAWGRGLMSEAVELVTWLAFEHLDAQLVYAHAFEGNLASARVLAKAGFEHDPQGSLVVQKRGEDRVQEFHGLARSAWERRGRPGAPRESDVHVAR